MLRSRVLIAGGAGFIGSHLCSRLLKAGHEVLCVDNFHTGSRDNVAQFLDRPAFTLRQHDITVPITVEIDCIYNLACPASPVHYQSDPVRTIRSNVHCLAHRNSCTFPVEIG